MRYILTFDDTVVNDFIRGYITATIYRAIDHGDYVLTSDYWTHIPEKSWWYVTIECSENALRDIVESINDLWPDAIVSLERVEE